MSSGPCSFLQVSEGQQGWNHPFAALSPNHRVSLAAWQPQKDGYTSFVSGRTCTCQAKDSVWRNLKIKFVTLTQISLSFISINVYFFFFLWSIPLPYTTQIHSHSSLSCRLKEGGISCQPQEKRPACLQLRALKRLNNSEEIQDSRLVCFSILGPRGSML